MIHDSEVTVEVQAWHKVRESWVTVASTTSSRTESNINGDVLYAWSTSVRFVDVADHECYWGFDIDGVYYCSIPASLATARTRVIQRSDREDRLITFDLDDDCLVDKWNAGVGGHQTGVDCASPESPVITLRMLT